MYAAVSAACGAEKLVDGQDAIERVADVETYQIIKFNCSNTLVDTRDDLLGDCCGINMFSVESVTQSRNSGCDLVELNTLLATICEGISIDSRRSVL